MPAAVPKYCQLYLATLAKKIVTNLSFFREMKDPCGEAKASSNLGDVYLQMGEYEKAMEFHQLDYDLSEAEEDNSGKVNITRKLAINCEFMVARIVILNG